jgi:hypothetical protein
MEHPMSGDMTVESPACRLRRINAANSAAAAHLQQTPSPVYLLRETRDSLLEAGTESECGRRR